MYGTIDQMVAIFDYTINIRSYGAVFGSERSVIIVFGQLPGKTDQWLEKFESLL